MMNTRTIAIVSATALALGAGGYALITGSKNGESPAKSATTRTSGTMDSSRLDGDLVASPNTTRTERARQEPTFPALTSRYGESRTKLSHHVSLKFLSLVDDVAQLAEMAKGHEGFRMGGRGLGDLPDKLALTPDQVASAKKLMEAHQDQEMDKLKDISAQLRKEPDDLMEALLASDAYARKEISEEEYQNITKKATGELSTLFGNMPGAHREGNPVISDPDLRNNFSALLTPEQKQSFQTMAEESDQKQAEAGSAEEIKTPIPLGNQAMELEKMDQTLTSASTMMKGVQQMLEGAMTLPPEALPHKAK